MFSHIAGEPPFSGVLETLQMVRYLLGARRHNGKEYYVLMHALAQRSQSRSKNQKGNCVLDRVHTSLYSCVDLHGLLAW